MSLAEVLDRIRSATGPDARLGRDVLVALGLVRIEAMAASKQGGAATAVPVCTATGQPVAWQDPTISWSGAIRAAEARGLRPVVDAGGGAGVAGLVLPDDGRPGPLRMTQAVVETVDRAAKEDPAPWSAGAGVHLNQGG